MRRTFEQDKGSEGCGKVGINEAGTEANCGALTKMVYRANAMRRSKLPGRQKRKMKYFATRKKQ
jgi:hypothetical protein